MQLHVSGVRKCQASSQERRQECLRGPAERIACQAGKNGIPQEIVEWAAALEGLALRVKGLRA